VEFSRTYSNAKFLKVNVDDCPAIAQKCGISAMPTFHMYKNGSKIGEVVGADQRKLEDAIKQGLA
jgi:thioredoxin 1